MTVFAHTTQVVPLGLAHPVEIRIASFRKASHAATLMIGEIHSDIYAVCYCYCSVHHYHHSFSFIPSFLLLLLLIPSLLILLLPYSSPSSNSLLLFFLLLFTFVQVQFEIPLFALLRC